MSITFLIPIYNEVKTVKKAIEETIKLDVPSKEIIIIDNKSTDGSRDIIDEYRNRKNIHIIYQKKNLGFGNSIQDGFLKSSNEFIFIQYGDLEYEINTSIEMLKLIKERNLDVIFASRLKNIKNIKGMMKALFKKPSYIATIVCTFLVNILFNKNFTDIIGTRLYRRKVILPIIPKTSGQGFDFELASLISKKDLKFEEVFIEYRPRKNNSEKKIKFYHMFNAIYAILKIKFFYK
ncbi:glycosyltransferase family 2 protein [Candidatus Pelagibacter sp.]|jgi:glycosyltransferase involved in cell wall biosynthesis|nr:glycosyltransferase family 2 protein [Candidatus Pelagibacter sp.]